MIIRLSLVKIIQRLQSDWLSHILLTYSGDYFCLSLLFLISLLFLLYMVYTLVTWSKNLISSWTYLSHAHKHDIKIQDNSRKYNWYILYKYKITLRELIFAGTKFRGFLKCTNRVNFSSKTIFWKKRDNSDILWPIRNWVFIVHLSFRLKTPGSN